MIEPAFVSLEKIINPKPARNVSAASELHSKLSFLGWIVALTKARDIVRNWFLLYSVFLDSFDQVTMASLRLVNDFAFIQEK